MQSNAIVSKANDQLWKDEEERSSSGISETSTTSERTSSRLKREVQDTRRGTLRAARPGVRTMKDDNSLVTPKSLSQLQKDLIDKTQDRSQRGSVLSHLQKDVNAETQEGNSPVFAREKLLEGRPL
jgi:hypothetical protein